MTFCSFRKANHRGFGLTAAFAALVIVLAFFAVSRTQDQAVLIYSTLPRLAAGLLSGALLGLGGAVFQRVFTNPLAEPSLLGITGGAALSMAASLIFVPVLWSHGYQLVALAGAALALIIVLAVAWGPRLSSQTLILTGVMINLLCNAAYAILVLFNHDFLSNLLTWQAGSLQQSGWRPTVRLAVLLALAVGPLGLLERPLRLLALGDGGAAGLGLSVRTTKLLLLVLASSLAAFVAAEFGQIGLIGLAAPALSRAIWRQPHPGLLKAAVTGALLLSVTDQFMRLLASFAGDLPVGAAAGLLAGPVLIFLARRGENTAPVTMPTFTPRGRDFGKTLAVLTLILGVVFTLALFFGRGEEGWAIAGKADLAFIWRWRFPPLLAAASAGFCLALAGLLLQRLLRNPLASPDILGIGHGAGLALAIAFIILPTVGVATKFTITSTGAATAIFIVTILGARSRFEPTRMLLLGVGLASTANAMLVLALAGGGQRGAALLGWFAGMTAGADLASGVSALAVGMACLLVSLCMHRQIDLIALDDKTATSFGVGVRCTRLIVLGVAALATAAGTMVVGPISFIGLMVPHFAAVLGFRKTASISVASALIGALIMTACEWLARNLAWPWPLSPSLLAALVGGPWFLWHLRRQSLDQPLSS
ncbi:Fe(3+)-hydroxamate ABC transporter permease FhuB [Rhizobium sp. RM]|uniref:Fe(3+)-hydroxamate ABC transporter permease FhuB n=1 Tax=Rhizobium sp. RM TaxID=2748079 RepID=UPI00110D3CE8|nr:Fe(3+)-hydroxamate ABC transporter permease FhuB [Rhizobium sp. RM]TMV21721.1 Fe(3+)-hydroxamate ABC transporter permease FhuB [Rhizobium sp. Td3]